MFELDENASWFDYRAMPTAGNYEDFKAALRISPVSISFATTHEFFNYESGIYDNPSCPT